MKKQNNMRKILSVMLTAVLLFAFIPNIRVNATEDGTKEIVLAHLSEEANSKEQAIEDYKKVFKKRGFDFNKYLIRCASQHEILNGGLIKEQVKC